MMKKSFAWLCVSGLMVVGLLGCGGNPPMIELTGTQYSKIAIAPFAIEAGAEEMARMVSDLGTSLSLALEEKEWTYDQSEQLAPLGDAIQADKLTADELFVDPALAAKVAKSVDADLILVGKIGKPKIQTKEDPNIYYDKSTYSVSGTATRFVLQIQSATEDVGLKLVDPKNGTVAWQGNIKGYIKYFREFMQQDPAKDTTKVSDEQIRADMRAHLQKQIKATLFPLRFTAPSIPEILAKPSRPLVRSGGKPMLF